MLRELGFGCAALHSKMPREQKERLASLQLFRSFQVPILVCTDIGARGLDMDGVGMVVNWDLPRNPKEGSKILESGEAFQTAEETYVHRVGRTARMGRGGFAVSFVTERKWDEETVKRIETKISGFSSNGDLSLLTSGTDVQLSEYKMNEDAVLEKLNLVSAAKRLATMVSTHTPRLTRATRRQHTGNGTIWIRQAGGTAQGNQGTAESYRELKDLSPVKALTFLLCNDVTRIEKLDRKTNEYNNRRSQNRGGPGCRHVPLSARSSCAFDLRTT